MIQARKTLCSQTCFRPVVTNWRKHWVIVTSLWRKVKDEFVERLSCAEQMIALVKYQDMVRQLCRTWMVLIWESDLTKYLADHVRRLHRASAITMLFSVPLGVTSQVLNIFDNTRGVVIWNIKAGLLQTRKRNKAITIIVRYSRLMRWLQRRIW